MTIAIAAFTAQGESLAETLGQQLGGTVVRCGKQGVSLGEFAADAFSAADAIIFVGAAGIAVRAIAPHLRSKVLDPAVVVVDEAGRYAIPVLSGHLGGANALARRISGLIGAIPVITTATDLRGVFAIDEWARLQGCTVTNPGRIRAVSGALLQGGTVSVYSEFPVAGAVPEGILPVASGTADAALTIHRQPEEVLCVVPGLVVLGIGCRAGTSAGQIEALYQETLEQLQLLPEAVCGVATVDLKQNEAGLLHFCRQHGFRLTCYSAEELSAVPGEFNGSDFVRKTVGTDNVCERSAVRLSGGRLIYEKTVRDGVTMAAAIKPFCPDWRWKDE